MKLSPGRPLEFDPDAALDAAMQIFWRNGYENTSMQNLLDGMNLSKSSLYQAFGGKQALFERCMTRYGDEMIASLRHALQESPSGLGFIRQFLESVLDEARAANFANVLEKPVTRSKIAAILQLPEGVEWNEGQKAYLVVAIAAQSDEHKTRTASLPEIKKLQNHDFLIYPSKKSCLLY